MKLFDDVNNVHNSIVGTLKWHLSHPIQLQQFLRRLSSTIFLNDNQNPLHYTETLLRIKVIIFF